MAADAPSRGTFLRPWFGRRSDEGAMRIERLLHMTSARLVVVDANAMIRTAAASLSNRGIGLVVICNEDGKAAGVLSKSDLVRYLALPQALEPSVSTLMSQPFVSCAPEDDVHAVWQTMAERDLQNVPVLNADTKPIGVLDIRDAMKVLFEQEELQEHMLVDYIAGVGYR
jgi:CBS domain-containing protein